MASVLSPRFLRRVRLGRCVRLGACAALPQYLGVLWLVRPVSTWGPALTRGPGRCPNERLQRLGSEISVEVSPDESGHAACALLLREQFPPKSRVFVNMVKTNTKHFSQVAATTRCLSDAGFDPIPHLPISRLATSEDFHLTLKMLSQAGAKQLLLVGGNDLPERLKRNELRYRSVADLLKDEIESLKSEGIQSVALAGLPDSPHWCSGKAATKVLVDKARLVLQVATQFCFNPRRLLRWLTDSSAALEQLQKELGVHGSVSFRIGVPGPTRLQKLRRIADICQVPGDFLHPSMFDLVLQGASRVTPLALESSHAPLGLGRSPERRAELFAACCGEDGLLGRAELAELLWQDVQAELESTEGDEPVRELSDRPVSGPSAFVSQDDRSEDALFPEDVLWALTTKALDLPIQVNLYPFGGLSDSLSLARSLREGTALAASEMERK